MKYKVWTVKDIRKILDEFGDKMGMSCKNIPVEIINTKNTFGLFSYEINHSNKKLTPKKFEFSLDLISGNYSEEVVIDAIGHEYIHFYTIIGTGVAHGHSPLFKKNCRELGVSDETYFNAEPEDMSMVYKYTITCKNCGNIFGKQRIPANYKEKFCCAKCEGELEVQKNW